LGKKGKKIPSSFEGGKKGTSFFFPHREEKNRYGENSTWGGPWRQLLPERRRERGFSFHKKKIGSWLRLLLKGGGSPRTPGGRDSTWFPKEKDTPQSQGRRKKDRGVRR